MYKLDLEKAEELEIKLSTSIGSSKKQEFQKNICFVDYAKAFDCVDHNKLENSSRGENARPPDLPLEKSVCRSGSNKLEVDMEQQTGSKQGKEIASKYCISDSFVDYVGYSISSKGFLPTVVDIMVL